MYKVRCKLVRFEGDVETFPCHFKYEIGDEIYYDGVQFDRQDMPAYYSSYDAGGLWGSRAGAKLL